MTVSTVRIVSDDNVRTMATYDSNEFFSNPMCGRSRQVLIAVPEQVDITNAQDRRCFAQFRLPQSGQFSWRAQGRVAT
jgi:hypothetical protein